jgi:lipopolysaccharide biosynthesis glycosyltransferase
MTEFDSIVYLDLDTLVLGNIENLHELVADPSRTGFELAAVADHWEGKFAYHFNAGVLVLHPSTAVFHELMRTMQLPGNYDPLWAEQAFLNAFFQLRYLQLPLIYNVNLSFYVKYADLWEKLQRDFKIVHYTDVKPFQDQNKKGFEMPIKLYNDAWKEFSESFLAKQIKTRCG